MLQPVDRMPTAPAVPPISVGYTGPTGAASGGAGGGNPASGPGPGGGGGYVFSPEEIDSVIKQWKDLYQDLEADETEAQTIADIKPPGLEFASQDFADVAGPSGNMLREQVIRMQHYVADYINALIDARDATQTTDENAATQSSNAAGQA